MSRFKTIYFSDYADSHKQRSGLTVAFGPDDAQLFSAVERLSSFTLRKLLGFNSISDLQDEAERANLNTSSFVRSRLAKIPALREVSSKDDDTALQSTFAGGRGIPLHDWFPYLEGYSPDFVRSILETRMADAQTVLDPFCGSGTTALTGAMMGLQAEYCEVNPVCRDIIHAKLLALSLDDARRSSLSDMLAAASEKLKQLVKKVRPDDGLAKSFAVSFGSRPFFDASTFSHVLKLRTLIDDFKMADNDFGLLSEVAALGALVNNSLLIRRGDLRFRNEAELARHQPNLIGEVADRLMRISSDLRDLEPSLGKGTLVCPNARDLFSFAENKYDAIVTSPPYLNGTNYFRNTKIELWFARYLVSKHGLRGFRDAAITAGINDVTGDKARSRTLPKSVLLTRTLEQLERSAYDQRIPMMVASYFSEMFEVAMALRGVTRSGGKAAIDLGDSTYGGVHVPTDLILRELFEAASFKFAHEVVLRERQSRAGTPLRQTLQFFEAA